MNLVPIEIFKTEVEAMDFGNTILDNTVNQGNEVKLLDGIIPSNGEQNKAVDDVTKASRNGEKRGESNSDDVKVEIQKCHDATTECTN